MRRAGDGSDSFTYTVSASASVVADTARQADALSTSPSVLGLEKGQTLIRRTPGADALLVLNDGRSLATPGF